MPSALFAGGVAFINGQAELVAYHIHAGPDGRVPQIPGVPNRGEYGSVLLRRWRSNII